MVPQSRTCTANAAVISAWLTYNPTNGGYDWVMRHCQEMSAPGLTWGAYSTVHQSSACPAGSIVTNLWVTYNWTSGSYDWVAKQCREVSAPGLTWGEIATYNASGCTPGSVMVHAWLLFWNGRYYMQSQCQEVSVIAPATPPSASCDVGFHFDNALEQCVLDTPVITDIILTIPAVEWNTTAVIFWSAQNANSCTGTGFDTGNATSGSVTTDPLLQTTTFTLTCDTGTKSVTAVIDSCPTGYTGTPPVCTLASSPGTCPVGYEGTPPNCTAATSCPLGYGGTPPNCVCTPSNICSGNNVVNSCTGALIQACVSPAQCNNGLCVVPAPKVTSWQVSPLLVKRGSTVDVSWDITHVASCTVTGSNGDSWTGLTGNKVSRPITVQTIFTLRCPALSGSGAADVSRTATVNIVPVFNEK